MFTFLHAEKINKKYKTKELEVFTTLCACGTYADKQINNNELQFVKNAIKKTIKKEFDIQRQKEFEKVCNYYYDFFKKKLYAFKADYNIYEIEKEKLLNNKTILRKENINLLKDLFFSDNNYTDKEKLFLDFFIEKNRNIQKKKKKSAFTLIEIIITILLSSLIASLSYKYYQQNRWFGALNVLDKNILFLLNNGVMDTAIGYVNGTGGDCSSGNNYIDISAGRMIDCVGYGSSFPYGGTKNTNGSSSYVKIPLSDYMPTGETCKMYLDDKSSDEYYMYIDCSAVNYDEGSSRAKKTIENKINAYLRKNLVTIYQSVNFNATSVTNPNGGNSSDGKLRILFKK